MEQRINTPLTPQQAAEAANATREAASSTPSFASALWRQFRTDRLAVAGLCVAATLIVLAAFAPLISSQVVGHGPNELFQKTMTTEQGLPKGPNSSFLFGADQAGRDVLVRTLYGARTDLSIALFAVGISTVFGVVLGAVAGFSGGWLDSVISRFTDVALALPVLLLALGIVTTCGLSKTGCVGGAVRPGILLITVIIALFSWMPFTRLARGLAISIREQPFIEASRALGARRRWILLHDVLPNMATPILIFAVLQIPTTILFAATLSFLGLGVPENIPSWGKMLAEAGDYMGTAWWLMVFPGAFLLASTLAFTMVGDGLAHALRRTEA
jgi:peptide/nickel transport system permease protein